MKIWIPILIFLYNVFLETASKSFALSVSEYQIKGAMLYKFGQFTDWPPGPILASQSAWICILGKDPFGSALDEALKSRSIHDRPIGIKRILDVSDASLCSILFIGTQDQNVLKSVLGKVKSQPILTVGEAENFTKLGGVIRIFQKGQSVHFEVNIDAMKRSGLSISSKMLTLAQLYQEKQ